MEKDRNIEVRTEKITVEEGITFYMKYKEKIWAVALLVIGLFGGNVDRIVSALPDVYGIEAVKTKVVEIDGRVKVLEGAKPATPPVVVNNEPDVKVEKPLKKIIEALTQ